MEFTSGFSLPAKLFIYAARVLELATVVMVLVWCIHFRGGLSFKSTDESLIFNVIIIQHACSSVLCDSCSHVYILKKTPNQQISVISCMDDLWLMG